MSKLLNNIKDVTDHTEGCETTCIHLGLMNEKQRIAFGIVKNILDSCTGNDGQSGKEQLLLTLRTAAILIDGETLHGLLQLPVCST